MISFRGSQLSETRLPLGTVWLLEALAEAKGRHALYETQSPQILKALREMALVESAESSNRIEGLTVERARPRPGGNYRRRRAVEPRAQRDHPASSGWPARGALPAGGARQGAGRHRGALPGLPPQHRPAQGHPAPGH